MRKISVLITLLTCLSIGSFAAAEVEPDDHERVLAEAARQDQPLEVHGSAELQFRSEEGFDDADSQSSTTTHSDLSLDLELILSPTDWVAGTLALTWDDEDAFDAEEAYLTLGNPEVFPVTVAGGKMILPFGFYETEMVSDSLTLELGETHIQAIKLEAEHKGLTASIYLYNGKTVDDDDGFSLRSWGGNLSYLWEDEDLMVLVGTSWIENLEDSDGLRDYLTEEDLHLKNRVAGLSSYAFMTFDQLSLSLGYSTALEKPVLQDDDDTEKRDRPLAWSAEAAYGFEALAGLETIAAISYGQSDGLGDILPEKRFGAAITILPYEHLRLGVEYLREFDYSVSSGGTGDQADIFTLEVAFEF